MFAAMKIAVVIPDRGDRPEFTRNCLRMMDCQTRKPDATFLVNYPPESDKKDITQRYRKGYEYATNSGADVVFFIENDDWYSKAYIETMVSAWEKHGKPDIFGTTSTIYYHIGKKAWFVMDHHSRSSAMSTMIKAGLDLTWPVDEDPYTDIHLWFNIKDKLTFGPIIPICVGIKHGVGLCGGQNHTDAMHRYLNNDPDMDFLRKTIDEESFKFYTNVGI